MKPVIMKKTNMFRKLSLIMAFVLAFAQMPQTGLLLAYAEPAQESVSSPDEKVPEQESVSAPDAVSGNDAKENEEPVSGNEEETVSDGSVSEDAAGKEEETVSPDQAEAESEEAAGEVPTWDGNVSTWAGLQEAFNRGGIVKVKLTGDLEASSSDTRLVVPESGNVTLDLNRYKIFRYGFNDNPTPDDYPEDGGVILVKGNLTIDDTATDSSLGKITNGKSTLGGGILVDGGTLILKKGEIFENKAESGGGVYVKNGSFSMTGGIICNNYATSGNGAGVCIDPMGNGTASFDMQGGKIQYNKIEVGGQNSFYDGAGVYIHGNGCAVSFNMSGGDIYNNKNNCDGGFGGGVYAGAENNGTVSVNVTGGEIDANGADYGSGVYIHGNGGTVSFNMGDGKIHTNYASDSKGRGGGVLVCAENSGSAYMTMSGTAKITNNEAEYGGGVCISGHENSTVSFNMDGGTIYNNGISGYGGGIYVDAEHGGSANATINDGSVFFNKARFGGGVYVDGGQFTVSGGSIKDNTASETGGGAYVVFTSSTQLNMGGNHDFEINGNKDTNTGVSGNVCLAYHSADTKINVTGKLENKEPVGVKVIDCKTGELTGAVITKGLSGNGDLSKFTGEGGSIWLNSDGEAEFGIPLEGISIPGTASVEIGKTVTLTPTFTPAGAINKNVTWTVSNEKIATVANGVVTGVAGGETVVTAKSEEGGFTASCRVKVTNPAPVDPAKVYHTVTFMNDGAVYEKQKVEDGKTAKEPANAPSKAGYSFFGWTGGTTLWNFNTVIHSDITLNAKYIASAPETVSDNSGSGKDPVPVIDPVTKTIYLIKGQSYTAGGTGWTSSDKSVAKVAADTGKITAVKKGETTVTDEQQNTYNVIVAEPAFDKESKSAGVVVGETVCLKLAINSPNSESDKEYPVTWDSSNTKAATVADGVVTAVGKGSANIHAYIGGKTFKAKVSVKDTYAAPKKQTEKSISFNMNPLQSFNLKYDAKVFKVNGAVWSGDGLEPTKGKNGNPDGGYSNKVVLITKAGKFTAIGKGTTKITGKDADNNEVSVTVTVKPVSTKETTYININKTETIKFPKVNNSKAVWKSSNEKVIKDCAKGKVKGLAVGQSTISCTYNDFDFSTVVYVEDPAFKTDSVLIKNGNSYEMTLDAGKVYNRVRMDNVFQTVTCKSSKSSVAFIDENGVIYARKAGTANITTKINGKTYRIKVKVK